MSFFIRVKVMSCAAHRTSSSFLRKNAKKINKKIADAICAAGLE